jgi:uncharacterized membrane protein (Fun14 family)
VVFFDLKENLAATVANFQVDVGFGLTSGFTSGFALVHFAVAMMMMVVVVVVAATHMYISFL